MVVFEIEERKKKRRDRRSFNNGIPDILKIPRFILFTYSILLVGCSIFSVIVGSSREQRYSRNNVTK